MNMDIKKCAIKKLGKEIGINWKTAKFSVEQFAMGMKTELEHGSKDKTTDVTHNDPKKTAKIAWAHLKEIPDYYTRLKAMEKKVMKKSELKKLVFERMADILGLREEQKTENVKKAVDRWFIQQMVKKLLNKSNVQELPELDGHTSTALNKIIEHHKESVAPQNHGGPTTFHWNASDSRHSSSMLSIEHHADSGSSIGHFDVTRADKPKLYQHLKAYFPNSEHNDPEGYLTHP